MYRTTNALLLAALLGSACQGQTNPGTNPTDDGGTTTGGDLATTPPVLGMVQTTTIRELNSDKYPSGTHVRVVGVMQSPMTVAYAVLYNQACMGEAIVVQPDPSPSLKDGIVVRYIKRGIASGDMMIRSADCQQLVTNRAVRGDSVTVEGTLLIQNGVHSIDLGSLGSLNATGKAQTLPQPVVVTASQLPSAPFGSALVPQFVGAAGALVSFQTTVTSENNGPTATFKVSATAADTTKSRISTAYLQLAGAFTTPPDGTTYRMVTGLVSTDLGGTILPRDTADLVP